MVQWIGSFWHYWHKLASVTVVLIRKRFFLNPINHLERKIPKWKINKKRTHESWLAEPPRRHYPARPAERSRGWTDPVWPDCGPPLAPLSGPRGRQGWRGLRDQLHVLENKKSILWSQFSDWNKECKYTMLFFFLFYNFFSFLRSSKYINHHLNSILQHKIWGFLI